MPADISFASFNLYNFQSANEPVHRGRIVTQEEYIAKRDWIKGMIKKVDADVFGFQELWSKEALDDVLSDPELSDYHPIYLGDRWRGIAVAMAVREPWQVVGDVEIIKSFPFNELVNLDDNDDEDDEFHLSINRFSRSVIKVMLKHATSASTPELTVFACHLKSKLPSRVSGFDREYNSAVGSSLSTIRRTAEALALRMALIDHMEGEGTPTVVIGDLNDDPLSNTLNLITNQPSMSTRARGGDKSLYSALHLQLLRSFGDVYYTHEHNNHLSVLDHILVSEEFFEHSSDVVWKHSGTVVWNDYIDDDDPATTDHGIIKATFK